MKGEIDMTFFKSFFMRNWYYYVIGILCISMGLVTYFYYDEVQADELSESEVDQTIAQNYEEEPEICIIDIKGAIKNPDVYEVDCNTTINDAIKMAGGLKKDASTNNINLAKKVSNEMVIYVSTKKELKGSTNSITSSSVNTSSCKLKETFIDNTNQSNEQLDEIPINESNSTTSSIVNINTATKDELMNISGIGESKAISIISYREEVGCFSTIEDIMNVSGIGESLFEKIKNNITV